MNEFGPKSTLEDLECFAKNRNVRIAIRPPRYNSDMWTVIIRDERKLSEFIGYGDKVWIALDNATKEAK